MTRLSDRTLPSLASSVRRPAYDRAQLKTGIVHLGIGAFHRAHLAVYTDDVLASGDLGWGILGASLRSPDTRDALLPQNGLYAVNVRAGDHDEVRVIGALTGVVVVPENPAALLERMTDPDVRIVSLTVTEKGYCHNPATGELDPNNPDVRHDLEHPAAPRSAPGLIVEALGRRRAAGIAPFTVLSCDNLPSNGVVTKRVLAGLASLRDADLGHYVEGEVACPSTMVDRIVPATTDGDRDRVAALLGLEDSWPVMAEPFSQWVIEDHFPAGRPDWPGATFVADVEPFEFMKLRLLNGSHSTMAYLGYLSGSETIADAVRQEGMERLVRRLMDDEVTPTLPRLPGFDLAAYKDQLFQRFRNPALKHRTWQVAMDGSQKLPNRLLGPARERITQGLPIERIALCLAAWMRYVAGTDERGAPIDVRDPLATDLRARADAAGHDPDRIVDALLGMRQMFGTDLPAEPRFREPVRNWLATLFERGAAETVRMAAAM
ncbi:mannitol dehydrogenase family protein [Enterovirga sp. CN4-39]|uniref:mannitol dehydrogenase family protein n=1 Tax=Enterovirga sp. CN4-39 TaxID=3400910 RepID=UPI003C01FCF0